MEVVWFEAARIRKENRAHAVANAAQAAMLLETDREALDEQTPEERRLWSEYMAAVRRSVDANAAMDRAHSAWMNAQRERLRG